MEATALSLARSVLDGVLSSAGSAVADEVARLIGVPKERHRIAERIRDLKASVVELNQRNQRYHIVVVDGTTPARVGEQQAVVPYQDMLSSELAFQVSDVIGRNHEKTELIELISSSTTTTASSAGLRVVSVWGMGGMGKSSLVRMVHNDAALLDEFDYGAWVTVPHPLDSPDVFMRRLRKELGVADDQNLGSYLRDKRYRVIVDDLLSPEEWEHVCKVFDQFGDKEGSLIIVTTRREDVARHCARGLGMSTS
nr:unnamed protein product [Digitaria exilis]